MSKVQSPKFIVGAIDYPILLRLEGRRCVVVGGGKVAARKAKSLLECGAKVKVIAPELTPELAHLAKNGKIQYVGRSYRGTDIKGAFLVIGATDSEATNRRVWAEADKQGMLVNIVDRPELCSFTLPARFSRGPVTVAISTGGASPALARRLREILEEVIGPEFGKLATLLQSLREEVKESYATEAERRQAWNRMLDSDVLSLLRQGKLKEAKARAKACLLSRSA
jgi:precorrin-2 dehydrogenase/sirohydrochlorin ferrochelatase